MYFKNFLFAIAAGTTLCASAAMTHKNDYLGYFYAYNDTKHTITLEVGNFFPIPYTIGPNSYQTIFVSTNNQNIHIKKIG